MNSAKTLNICAPALMTLACLLPSAVRAQNSDPIAVTAASVEKKDVPVYLDYVGTTETVRSIVVQAKAAGFLLSRGAQDGADVKQGDLLYKIDPRDYQAALDQVTAQSKKDAAALEYARASQGRSSTLVGQGWASKDAFELASSNLHQAEANVAADDAAIRTARLNLSYTEIRAPFDGRLGRTQAYEGALIGANSALNTLVQIDPLFVTFNPSETDLPAIQARQAKGPVPAEVRVGDSGVVQKGVLTFLDNTVDRTTGTLAARVTIENRDKRMLPGQFVRVRLLVDELRNALLAPQTAVGSSQLGKFVYVAGADNKAVRRPVAIGANQGALVIVTEGLKDGDRVVTSNLQRLSDGSVISVQTGGGS